MSAKKYEHMSDGYSARFIDPKTGKKPPIGEYVSHEDFYKCLSELEAMRKWSALVRATFLASISMPPSITYMASSIMWSTPPCVIEAKDASRLFDELNGIVEKFNYQFPMSGLAEPWNGDKEVQS
jgi:hypothetical protein